MARSKGADRFKRRLERMKSPAAERKIEQALYAAADLVAVDAAISITTGAVSGKNHVPSRPGEPPNADTHELSNAIRSQKKGRLEYRVVSDSDHAVPMELGTSKVEARPHMGPALARNKDRVRFLVGEALRRVIKGTF